MEVEAKELQKKEQKKKEKENIEEDSDRDTDGEEKKADVSHFSLTGQSISSIGRVPIEILPGKRHIT